MLKWNKNKDKYNKLIVAYYLANAIINTSRTDLLLTNLIGDIMQVTQMINSNGNPASNQFIVSVDGGQYFQSYNTVIAYEPANGDTPTVSREWDCSATTLKHLKLFLSTSLSKKQLQGRIKSGSLILVDELIIK